MILFGYSVNYAQITVACAANVQYAMDELKAAYEKANGGEIKTIFGSSGKLTTQIKNGAPFDIFISADADFPESLFVYKFSIDKPKIYAYGKLVAWSAKNVKLDPKLVGIDYVKIDKFAIADPKRAPYGKEAERALKNAGLYDKISSKIVFGESITQVTQYIHTGTVDFGFNAKSVVLAGPMKNVGTWVEVDSTLYKPIAQSAVMLQYGQNNNTETTKKFYDFIYLETARKILIKYGYILP
jgi:molybdate transport system substrate-binding protein